MKLIALIVLTLTLSTSAFAQFFPASAQVAVLPGQVSAQVANPYYEPIICSGFVFGQTAQGAVYNTFFAQQLMVAGTFRYAYVVTHPYNPFVGGWTNIQCRFARW